MASKKEILKLKDTIQLELGVDIAKYQDDEVAENLLDLLLFPKYILKWVLRPILISILIYIAGFFIIDLVNVQYIIYGVVGFVLFITLGILFGIVNLGKQLGDDVSSISEYSLGILKNSVMDLSDIGDRVNKNNVGSVLGLLFKGVIFVVTIPMLKRAIDKKVPAGKGIAKRLIGGSLAALASRITFDADQINENAIVVDGESKFVTKYVASVDKASKGVSNLLDKVIRIGSAPFRIGIYIIGFITVIFLYLIW